MVNDSSGDGPDGGARGKRIGGGRGEGGGHDKFMTTITPLERAMTQRETHIYIRSTKERTAFDYFAKKQLFLRRCRSCPVEGNEGSTWGSATAVRRNPRHDTGGKLLEECDTSRGGWG